VEFTELVEDFLCLFEDEELEAEPFLRLYIVELLARWGRWKSKGRAANSCFEAAAAVGMRFLESRGWQPSERTERVDRALAGAMTGMTVDALEPEASRVMREKAVSLLTDEFLARAASPKLREPVKKRARKRRSRMPMLEEKVKPPEDKLRVPRSVGRSWRGVGNPLDETTQSGLEPYIINRDSPT
jgi:hypothetical protein